MPGAGLYPFTQRAARGWPLGVRSPSTRQIAFGRPVDGAHGHLDACHRRSHRRGRDRWTELARATMASTRGRSRRRCCTSARLEPRLLHRPRSRQPLPRHPRRERGCTVERHRDHFPPDCPDDEWLRTVGERGWVAVSRDSAHPLQAQRAERCSCVIELRSSLS